MTYHFEPHPENGPSGVPRHGDVPAHWDNAEPVNFSEEGGRNCPGELILSLTITGGVIP